MKWNEIVAETSELNEFNVSSSQHMINGHTIPDWSISGEEDVAQFSSQDGRTVELFFREGNYEVWSKGKKIYSSPSVAKVQEKLNKYRLTTFDGIHGFTQSGEEVIEGLNEGAELRCPNCDDYMGKASENNEKITCSNCGEKFTNVGGIRRNDLPGEKFGRLVLTNLTNEDGCVQGTLKTAKDVTLGSLIQYGPKWHDYDNGNWEAYCSAIKKRKKGFPDKKKAVEWIVRQTRVVMKANNSG
jgi:hypothetical protein